MATTYSTQTQVAQDAKVSSGFSASTTPTAAKVDEIIAEEGAAIDAKLSLKYVYVSFLLPRHEIEHHVAR